MQHSGFKCALLKLARANINKKHHVSSHHVFLGIPNEVKLLPSFVVSHFCPLCCKEQQAPLNNIFPSKVYFKISLCKKHIPLLIVDSKDLKTEDLESSSDNPKYQEVFDLVRLLLAKTVNKNSRIHECQHLDATDIDFYDEFKDIYPKMIDELDAINMHYSSIPKTSLIPCQQIMKSYEGYEDKEISYSRWLRIYSQDSEHDPPKDLFELDMSFSKIIDSFHQYVDTTDDDSFIVSLCCKIQAIMRKIKNDYEAINHEPSDRIVNVLVYAIVGALKDLITMNDFTWILIVLSRFEWESFEYLHLHDHSKRDKEYVMAMAIIASLCNKKITEINVDDDDLDDMALSYGRVVS